MLMDLRNAEVPLSVIPFSKAKSCKNKRQYVHFYIHDREFARVLTATTRYLDRLKEFDGIITPDCSMMIGQSKCLQQANTYMNRAVGFYCQKNGIPVIPNIRWSDESSFDYCFLGVPKKSIVSISTHGCIRSNDQKKMFRLGLEEMIKRLEPSKIIVYGYMPNKVFSDYIGRVPFYRYPSEIESLHRKVVK